MDANRCWMVFLALATLATTILMVLIIKVMA